MPPQSFGRAEILALDTLGGVAFTSIATTCRAVLFSAAATTFQSEEWHETVLHAAQDCISALLVKDETIEPL